MHSVPSLIQEPSLREFRAAEMLHFTAGDDIYQLYGTDSMALSYKVYDHMKKLALERSKEVQA